MIKTRLELYLVIALVFSGFSVFLIIFDSCVSHGTFVDMQSERIAPAATPALYAHTWYAEDMVFMPAGSEIRYGNKTILTKYKGYYFSKRYQEFCNKELLFLIGGGKLENTIDARRQRWREYIKKKR